MSFSDNAIVTLQQIYPYYGHSVDQLTARDVLEWKQIFVKGKITPDMASSLVSEVAAANETISDIHQVLPAFCQVARESLRKPKEAEDQAGPRCVHCRGKGIASIVSRRDPFDTESVACICKNGQAWAERCLTGPNPFRVKHRHNDINLVNEIFEFTSMHNDRAQTWAKERGLNVDDEPEFWKQWAEVKQQMAAEMFKSLDDFNASETEKKNRAASDTARRLTSVMKVRQVHFSLIPEGWEAVIYARDSGMTKAWPDRDGNFGPHPHARVVKQRQLEPKPIGRLSPPKRVDDRELALAAYHNGDERGWA